MPGYQPEESIELLPPFRRPFKPLLALKWLFGYPGLLFPTQAFFILLATLSWIYLTPNISEFRAFSIESFSYVLLRNIAFLTIFSCVLHVWLYSLRKQGSSYKYNPNWLSREDSRFLFRNQLWDNVFWSIASAVPIWTLYEAFTYWLQANGNVSTISFSTSPLYFVFLVLITPIWLDAHFYITHRILHWPPLYKHVHYLHHKNVNVGPWSGVAMHPIEHLIFFSSVCLYWTIPSSPWHVLYLLFVSAMGPATTHHGFDRVLVNGRTLHRGSYFHYLHHKHFRVNFGGGLVPFDKWLGTFHDGTSAAAESLKSRLRARVATSASRRSPPS